MAYAFACFDFKKLEMKMYCLVATTCLSFCTLGCSLRKLIFEKLSSFKIIEAQKSNILKQGFFRVNVHLGLFYSIL